MTIANWHFVKRNRIIAGLSFATVVVEAPAGSGALITVDFALENGRDVYFHKVCFSIYNINIL
jgi:DNA processing protein